MFSKILVPLDGSTLAECALTYAESIAKNCGTNEVVLISVTEAVHGRSMAPEMGELYKRTDIEGISTGGGRDFGVVFGKKEKQALKYLRKVANKMEGVSVRTEVLIGNPAEEITRFAESENCDLIVMSSHGRSGPSRWAHGSVAEKVFKAICIPVLMIHAPGCFPGV